MNKIQFKSRKDASEFLAEKGIDTSNWTEIQWLKLNKVQAEIHMMALAEAMWDEYQNSVPNQLGAGEWHIPFRDKINLMEIHPLDYATKDSITPLKISAAMAKTVGNEKEITIPQYLSLYNKMASNLYLNSNHFEHCARAMRDDEWHMYIRGKVDTVQNTLASKNYYPDNSHMGFSRNYRGFIPYTEILENK